MKNLKKLLSLWMLPVFAGMFVLLFSCSEGKDDDTPPDTSYMCASCKTTPDALAVNDASVKGVYKGIVVASTGTLSLNIQNGSSAITATLVLDGITATLTSTVLTVDGQPYIAPFTGTYNGSPISMTFSVGLGGSTPTITSSSIPGHPNAVFELYKETSTSMIEAFQGTYTVSDGRTGVFNVLLTRAIKKWGYIAKDNGQSETDSGSGIMNGDKLVMENGTTAATITGDVLNGSFLDSNAKTVTVTGKRTL